MFIKQAYENRLKKELEEENKYVIKQKQHMHKIGSIKNKRINYDKDEHFFSVEDIPPKVQEIKSDIKQLIDPDFLELRQKQWNGSIAIPKNPLSEETFERKMIKIKLGLFDHPLTKEAEKHIYIGTETRDNYAGWNVSTQCTTQKDIRNKNQQIQNYTQYCQFKNKEKEQFILRNYITNIDQQIQINEQMRQLKLDEKEFREQIRKEYLFNNPASSKEKTDGAVFRLAYEKKLLSQKMIQDDPEQSLFKPDTTLTLKSTKQKRYYHTGVWQSFKFKKKKQQEYEGFNNQDSQEEDPNNIKIVEAWSCCMNQNQDSEGCNLYIVDKNKWNLESFKQY